MKKINLLIVFCFSMLTFVQAQIAPKAFNYSAVARNSSGQPITTTAIGIQISILKTTSTGTIEYSENHVVNTDAFGLFNLVVGGGAVQSGSMNSIDWSNDNYFLKVDMDVNGGTNFQTMGVTQLLSVPYALYAETAESIVGGTGGFTHYIGEEYEGGVIFHLWKDNLGIEHGLIVDLTDLSSSQIWSNVANTFIGVTVQSQWDGLSNSNAIISQSGHTNSAASLCLNSTNGGQNDWYLPAFQELKLLWENYFNVSMSLSQISGAVILAKENYHSSTAWEEIGNNFIHGCNFGNGDFMGLPKDQPYYVRAIRSF